MLDPRELRDLSDDDLLDRLEDAKETLFNLRFQKASGQLENVNMLREAKRDLSRVMTILRERELAVEVAAALAAAEGTDDAE